MKYQRKVVGRPYIKYDPALTRGFVPGVGYLRNLLATHPSWFAVGVMYVVGGVFFGYKALRDRNLHPDYRIGQRESYDVRRRSDIDDTSRTCYN
ncbi:hypothetical protein ACF0H5_000367 [Mactra antiquata]